MKIISDLSPIVIASPIIRSGTTLIQRLCCSSENGLIYGDLAFQDMINAMNMTLLKKQFFGSNIAFFNEKIDAVKSGNCDVWTSELLPEMNEYLDKFYAGAMAPVHFLKEYAEKNNRSLWGIKIAGLPLNLMQMLINNLPQMKLIYIHRNPDDALKSAKGAQIIQDPEQIAYFLDQYHQVKGYESNIAILPNTLLLDYDEVIANPLDTIQKIEEFTGLKNIDASIFDTKINTTNEVGYMEPLELNEEEQKVVERFNIA